jgi:hypothetical protein
MPRPERLYQGRPLSAWLNDLQQWSGDPNDPAFAAFRNMGTNALSDLLRLAQQRPSYLQNLIATFNQKQSLIKLPVDDTSRQSPALMWALYATGSNALPGLPVLTNMLFGTNGSFISAMTLAGLGPEGVPFLLQASTNREFRIRVAAASALGREREALDDVVAALLAALVDSNAIVRENAIGSLGEIHSFPEIVVPVLINNYSNNDHAIVMISLAQFQTNARAAIPTVKTALNDPNSLVRSLAAFALRRIDPSSQVQDK